MNKKVCPDLANWIEGHAVKKLNVTVDSRDKLRTSGGATMAYISALITLSFGAAIKVLENDSVWKPIEIACLGAVCLNVCYLTTLAVYLGRTVIRPSDCHVPGFEPCYLLKQPEIQEPTTPLLALQSGMFDVYDRMIRDNLDSNSTLSKCLEKVWLLLWLDPLVFLLAFAISWRIAWCGWF